jgi:tRNA U38,U39,U40 pseudouridine synthase TruA
MPLKREAEAYYLRSSDAWDLITELTKERMRELHDSLRGSQDFNEFKSITGEMQGVEFILNAIEDIASQWEPTEE